MRIGLLLGNEAVGQAALDAGIAGAFSYPGTPSTEIFEYVHERGAGTVSALWSANEKVAYEEALGMSYAGRRALVSMKHVGLNVASDPFVNSALTGVRGGLVLVVADDPGMHSSQNEQDSRFFGDFAKIPIFEPADQQEAYDLTLEAFDYSERVGLPVMVRVVTRLCHSRANVVMRPPEDTGGTVEVGGKPDPNAWTLVPVNARRRFQHLLGLQEELRQDSERSPWNRLTLAGRHGVIASGLARNYVHEVLAGEGDVSLLELRRYPVPVARLRELVQHCDDVLVVEEGYPFIEERLNGLLGVPGKSIRGKLTGDLPPTGELTPDSVATALGREPKSALDPVADLAGRPPQLCRGCPHADSFKAIVEATATYAEPILFSDIGCYTLGVMPPYRAVHACVDMGASIAMAHGAAQAGARPVVCTIGDSTFGHSGMTGLLGAAQADADMTVFILDNSTVAMTGTQDSLTTGDDLLAILRGLGVKEEHLHVIDPLSKNHSQNVEIIRREVEHHGLSVIVPTRACIHLRRQKTPVPVGAADAEGGAS